MHDAGKALLPADLLARAAPLATLEAAHVRQHAALGAALGAGVLDPEQARWVRHHHERWDGAGYPDGPAGLDIPDGARILALADAWDAMTTDRPYRAALSADEAPRRGRPAERAAVHARGGAAPARRAAVVGGGLTAPAAAAR